MVEFYVDIIGYIGAFFISMMFVPQVYHIHKNKQVTAISYQTQFMSIIASIVMLIYGILLGSIPIIISNSCVMLCVLIIICLKYKFESDD
jgi:MtN3 and saliva related transmembrane protein